MEAVTLVLLWVLLAGTLCAPSSVTYNHTTTQQSSAGIAVEVLQRFPNHTWLENIAVRPNGQVLVTLLTSPDIYAIDPSKPRHHRPVLVHSFTKHLSLFGIAELQPDVFYVIAENYSQPTNKCTPGAGNVYRVDMCGHRPNITLAAHFPESVLLNGLAVLSDTIMLVGDAGAGVVYSLNVKTGAIAIAIDDPIMKPPADHPVGIDGVQIWDKNLYFTNAPLGKFVKIPLNTDGTAAGPARVLLENLEIDDFTLDADGDAFLAVTFSNEIARLHLGDGNATVIAGPSTELAGPTACKFGRTAADSNMLYVATNGGLGIADNSTAQGGTLSRIDLGGQRVKNKAKGVSGHGEADLGGFR